MMKGDKNKIIDWETILQKKELSELAGEDFWALDDFMFDDDVLDFAGKRDEQVVPRGVRLSDDLYFDIKAHEEMLDSLVGNSEQMSSLLLVKN
ncbi:Uncharacterised protein [Streptococcus pasteurianus]|nr:Uncharacterised protein [Streptococcus pasteurianus]